MRHTILVTGGAGYIGAHTSFLLAQAGYTVIILDLFLHNQSYNHPYTTVIKGDYGDKKLLSFLFSSYQVTAVMHFASLIEVGQSVHAPLDYYKNNVANTITLLESMHEHAVDTIIFSSSCAIYGNPLYTPIDEDHPQKPISPYGATKQMIEQILYDAHVAHGIKYVALRYFNASGALPEHSLYEQHNPETHLIPLVLKAAMLKHPFYLFGADHDTKDGSCVRDFVHVVDIAHAHICALRHLQQNKPSDSFNLGTGKGSSVREIVSVVEKMLSTSITTLVTKKRMGDPPTLVAKASKAHDILGWYPQNSDLLSILQSALKAYLAATAPTTQKMDRYHTMSIANKTD